MKLNNDWIGIKDCQDDVMMSIDKYGFASSFYANKNRQKIYNCILPNEKYQDCYYSCQLSLNDIIEMIDEHPNIPISHSEKTNPNIGYMLYLLDLYDDLYELIDLSEAEQIDRYSIEYVDDSLDHVKVNLYKKKPQKIMSKDEAIDILHAINVYKNQMKFFLDVPSYRACVTKTPNKLSLVECCDLLRSYNLNMVSFLNKISIEGNRIYMLKKTKYIELI